MPGFSEAEWEQVALELLAEPLDWQPKTGEQVAPGSGQRDSWDELLIRPRLLDALRRLNPTVPGEYLGYAGAVHRPAPALGLAGLAPGRGRGG